MKARKIHVIINPASSAGKTGKRLAEILACLNQSLGPDFSYFATGKPLDAQESARRAALEGSGLIIAVGGDGTIQEVANGMLSVPQDIRAACELGILNCGTGHGFAQSLRLPKEFDEQLELLANGPGKPVDVCRIVYTNDAGAGVSRFYVNECQIGIGSEVVRSVRQGSKKLGGSLAFGAKAVFMLFRYSPQPIHVSIDGGPEIFGRLIGVMATNGDYAAGGMNLAPRARLNDAKLDLVLIREQALPLRLWNFGKIYAGKHVGSSKIDYRQARRVALNSAEKVAVEADGEMLGWLPCRIEVVPAALRVRAKLD